MPMWPFAGRQDDLARLIRLAHDGAARGIVIAGPSGVGKTRLAAEVLRTFRPTSHTVIAIRATSAAGGIPYGALAGLLPPEAPAGLANPLRWAADAVRSHAAGRRLVLAVDDAHLLDGASAAAVHHLVAAGDALVVATLRTGEPAPDSVTALWRDGPAARADVGPLSLADTAAILAAALGGRPDDATVRRLGTATEGNALLLHEVVGAAREAGTLRQVRGMWQLTGEPPMAPRLTELVRERVGALSPEARAVLELTAFGEPVGLTALLELTAPDAVEQAEDRGLIRLSRDGRRVAVRLGHPLYGEVARAGCPPLRRRNRYAALAAALERGGARRRDDLLRLTVWRLESGAQASPGPLLSACGLAWSAHDYPLAIRLGRAALAAGGGVEAAVLLATVLDYAQFPDEAHSVLIQAEAALPPPSRSPAGTGAAGTPGPAPVGAPAAAGAAGGSGGGGPADPPAWSGPKDREGEPGDDGPPGEEGEPGSGGAAGEEADPGDSRPPGEEDDPGDGGPMGEQRGPGDDRPPGEQREPEGDRPPGEEELRTRLALARAGNLAWGMNRLREALDLLDRAEATLTDPAARRQVAMRRLDLAAAAAEPRTALRLGSALLGTLPAGPGRTQILKAHALALCYAGRTGEAVSVARQALADAGSWQDAMPAMVAPLHSAWAMAGLFAGDLAEMEAAVASMDAAVAAQRGWSLGEGSLALARGHLATARGRAETALGVLHDAAHHPTALTVGGCMGAYAAAQALLGDAAGSRSTLEEALSRNRATWTGFTRWVALTRVWIAAAYGETGMAVELALAFAEECRAAELPGFEFVALHDAVRLGGAAHAAARLEELPALHDGRRVLLARDHARAAVAGDGGALLEVADGFQGLGMMLHAAEAAAQAAARFRKDGRDRAALTAAARAWSLARACEGARTPALLGLAAPELTARQLEIAQLAAHGLSNRDIADRLVLSVRTVANHLGAVYERTGAADRAALRHLFDDPS
ncbi:LuxR C-terminal-related transcriptional regulator [Sphaerisporangium sp. TRM90804]|uniref:helix-turn-helix transcriptional regulator n=1 Tax=Sphaerisporangium sp. TRM90804 TaxID=3031113 RepID=UPI00244BD224|nr:LuxR C-terminal-related transcriptional regulator [Sphaerisporangium sp. TRM90804]MDH2430671.1 LuxR C-terminal-related transcriptional regulator [Sphaerisporangium sp. TRM90804]